MSARLLLADQRHFVWTYEYLTMPPGEGELETYYTSSTPDLQDMEGNVSVEHQVELEVGMTPRFDFSIYQSFLQEPGDNLHYKGYKLRARYKFGQKGQYPLDPLLYLEYKGKPDFSEHGWETKLILAKDMGRLNLALNPVVEIEVGHGETEMEFEYALGTSYRFTSTLSLGLEAKGGGHAHYIGPVIAHGSEHLWVALGSAFALSSSDAQAPKFQMRLLLGIGL
jgi:hypothetical protein